MRGFRVKSYQSPNPLGIMFCVVYVLMFVGTQNIVSRALQPAIVFVVKILSVFFCKI